MYPHSFTMLQLLCEDRQLELRGHCARARGERSRRATVAAIVARSSRIGRAVISSIGESAAAPLRSLRPLEPRVDQR